MNLVIILLELFLASLVDSLKDINSTPVCATLNNAYMTFPNMWQIYNKFATTGQLWVPVSSGACPGNNNIDCTTISPVCAVSKNKLFKTFPNECLLEAEEKATGTGWNIVYKGVCSANPGQYSTQTNSIYPQTVNYNQDPAQTSAAIYPVHSSSYDTAPKIVMGHNKPIQMKQPLGKMTHLQLKKPEWIGNYNHKNFASNKALLTPLKLNLLPSYSNAAAGSSQHYNSAQNQQHSHEIPQSIAIGHYKPVQMQQPSVDYNQGSHSKPSGDYNQSSESKPSKSAHLQSENLKWSGNHHSLPKPTALSHPVKQNSQPSYENAPAASSGRNTYVHKLHQSPLHDTVSQVAVEHHKQVQIQQPSGDYNPGSYLRPATAAHFQSQNPGWSANYNQNSVPNKEIPSLSPSGHYNSAQKQEHPPSHDAEPSIASGQYKSVQMQQPSGDYNKEWSEKYHQNIPKPPASSYSVKPDAPLSYNNAAEAVAKKYNFAKQQQYNPSHATAPSIATGHYKTVQMQQPSGDYYQGSDLKPGASVHLHSHIPQFSENDNQNSASEPNPLSSCNNDAETASKHDSSMQQIHHSPSHDSDHYKQVKIEQPHLQSHDPEASKNYYQNSESNKALLPSSKPNPSPLYNNVPEAPSGYYNSPQQQHQQHQKQQHLSHNYYQDSDFKPGKSETLQSPNTAIKTQIGEASCSAGQQLQSVTSNKQNSIPNQVMTGHSQQHSSVFYDTLPSHSSSSYKSEQSPSSVSYSQSNEQKASLNSGNYNQGLTQSPSKLHVSTQSLASGQYNSEQNSQLSGNYNRNSASLHSHIQYYKPSQSPDNNHPQPSVNQGPKLHSSVHNKQSSVSSKPHLTQWYNAALSLSPKQFEPSQGTQHTETYKQSAAPNPTVSHSSSSFNSEQSLPSKHAESVKDTQASSISSDHNQSTSMSQSKSTDSQKHLPSPSGNAMPFNHGHWNSVQDQQTFYYYKKNTAPTTMQSHSSPNNNAFQSMGSKNFNQDQEPKTLHISNDNHLGNQATATGNQHHAPVYHNHLSAASPVLSPPRSFSAISVEMIAEKENQNSKKLPTYFSSPSAKSNSANFSQYSVKTQTDTLAISKQQQQSNTSKSVSHAATSDFEKSTPNKETSSNEKLHISPVIEKQNLPSHSEISNKISVTSDKNAEGHTIYNGVVYQGPYHYQPKYKHINFGNYNFWPFPVLASDSQNNGYSTNSSEQLLQQLQFIASKFNETNY